MSAVAGVSDAAIAVRDRLRGKIGLTKVRRYRRGMLPEWASDLDGDDHDFVRIPRAASVLDSVSQRCHSAARGDRRVGEAPEEHRADHRPVRRQGEVVSAAEEEGKPREAEVEDASPEDDEAQEERRRRIRERGLLREREEEELLPKEDEEELTAESESDSESEREVDSEQEKMCINVVKPVFVPKPQRDTVVEGERIEEERRRIEELVRRRMEERKVETRRIVVEVIIKEELTEKAKNEEPFADVDTDDEADEAKEYEAWKNREIERIRRDREARLRQGETVMARNMSGEERMEWEIGNSKPLAKSKKNVKFMQRYYHKGAFFQEKADDGSQMSGVDVIYKRDFSAPTGEDKMDKSILPKVMQVKKFGHSGRVKWTHLVNEDTTDWNNSWL
ncbi:unnamed protein product [Urochloa decumbens]|uniref:Micro-fibrillar-associated protein 1 C-terminal domain-containing protein n=1 Tax=Urochloa decumbens TaxID=240449 RepID=A0ABC9DXS8_9POAL